MDRVVKKRRPTLIEVMLVIVIVGFIALVGIIIWGKYQTYNLTDGSDSSQQDSGVEVPAIQTAEDLDDAATVLDATDIESTFDQQLQTQTDF